MPIIVLIVTFIVVPREGQEPPAETAGMQDNAAVLRVDDEQELSLMEDDAIYYDEAIESPGVLSRLTLLDF